MTIFENIVFFNILFYYFKTIDNSLSYVVYCSELSTNHIILYNVSLNVDFGIYIYIYIYMDYYYYF